MTYYYNFQFSRMSALKVTSLKYVHEKVSSVNRDLKFSLKVCCNESECQMYILISRCSNCLNFFKFFKWCRAYAHLTFQLRTELR